MAERLSRSDVRKVVREELREALAGLTALVVTINTNQNKIMATQAEIAAEVAAKTTQIRKAIDEVNTRLAALQDAIRNAEATPELVAAVAALGVAVQAADDIVPDAPPPA